MRDTLNNPQLISSMSDEALLLRQQEEFINQNRMHIEKRRHRSPDRNYSPPRRRAHSRERHVGGGRGGGGGRRGHSRDGTSPKRRRSGSFERENVQKRPEVQPEVMVEEDEDMRAYRLKIEKQKAMREKILRDKEMRRRRVAEEKTKHESTEAVEVVDKKVVVEEVKLKPIVVTERKIISLKKNPLAKDLPTAKVLPETKQTKAAMAIVKPVLKATESVVQKEALDTELGEWDEELDEDALLADSPPHSQETNTPPHPPNMNQITTTRRVVLNSRPGSKKRTVLGGSGQQEGNIGVFQRLEKRISVNEASKRKIQRIVIKNIE